jgi:hypothetical protein
MTDNPAEIANLELDDGWGDYYWFRTGTFYRFEAESKPGHVPV